MKKHIEDLKNLICIGVDGKVDKDTLLYNEVKGEDGETKLKRERGQEHHLTFTKEPGTESGTYLTHRVIPLTGSTGARLAEETAGVYRNLTVPTP